MTVSSSVASERFSRVKKCAPPATDACLPTCGAVTRVSVLFVPVTLLEAHLGAREGSMVGAGESALRSGRCSLAASLLGGCEQPHVLALVTHCDGCGALSKPVVARVDGVWWNSK